MPYSVRLSWESAHRTGFGLLRHARLPQHYTSRSLSCRASSTVLAPLQRNNGGTSGSPRYFQQVPPSQRKFGACAVMAHGHLTPPKPGEESVQSWLPLRIGSCTSTLRLHVTFVDKEGDEHTYKVSQGDNLLDIAQSEDLEMEGIMRPDHYHPNSLLTKAGACGGSCACSTCHVIVDDPDMYDKIPEPDDDENDMLDLAFGLTETSRLGCQVKMTRELDGLKVKLPSMTRNLQASDFSGGKKT